MYRRVAQRLWTMSMRLSGFRIGLMRGDVVMHDHQQRPDDRLETPKQLAKRVGISEGQVRQLLRTGQLGYVMIGSRFHIPMDEWPRFIAATRGRLCHVETKVRDCGTSTGIAAITSPGLSAAAAASAQQARLTAAKLKLSSRNGCSAGAAETGPVIPLRFS